MITWKIEWMTVKPQDGEFTDVVVGAGWRATMEQVVDGKVYNSGANGAINTNKPSSLGFTEYSNLTEEQVLAWVWESINKQEVEQYLQERIDVQVNPPIVQKPLPWTV